MKNHFILLASLVTILSSCKVTIENVPGVSLELAEYRKQTLSDITYNLALNIRADINHPIQGQLTASFTYFGNSDFLYMDFREDQEKLKEIIINGNLSEVLFENEHLILPGSLLNDGENLVEIEFIAGETSLNRNPEYLYTLFVPDRARTAFPLFDQPDLKAKYELTLELPKEWTAVANAPLAEKTEQDSSTIWNFAPSDLISSYLFSFVAGKFESITREIDGREMKLLHRETDREKVERNLNEIFELHSFSLDWLEDYTGIDYPFQKFDFALIPSFQYGGMEHVGAIQYRASSLFLDESPSESQLLSRASLIAHETAHMWFGDLVTMKWFNDVWTKEVFANFMAAKIMNPRFPEINHDLNFLVRHYPSAYSVDRSEGANPIRQELPNLNEAGTMYGAIIYNKAPIMMRQLELLLGEKTFQEGMQEYLSTFAFDNATWPDLIEILDQKTEKDLITWSEVWVNTAGRPQFQIETGIQELRAIQIDPIKQKRVWPQEFELSVLQNEQLGSYTIRSNAKISRIQTVSFMENHPFETLVPNSNGFGYGLFPQDLATIQFWQELDDVIKGSALVNMYENLLEGNIDPIQYFEELSKILPEEENQLILNLALGHLRSLYWGFFDQEQRIKAAPELESMLWQTMLAQEDASRKKIFYDSWESVVLTDSGLDRLYRIWEQSFKVDDLPLSENDFIGLAGTLAIKDPSIAESVTDSQLERINNPDRKRRFEFIKPALSPNQEVRDLFFESLKDEENRQTESWVLGALGYLHHPLRTEVSEKYILPSLELLEEIQVTGDIFFPGRWMGATLENYNSDSAVKTVREFLADRPDYNYQLRLKILQSADMLVRMNALKTD
ncbi:MAG: M1 family metallopeptidase [Balneola sp.]